MEVGDYIYCHTTGVMEEGEIFAHAGRGYLIEEIMGNELTIYTECGPGHIWSMDDPLFPKHFSVGGKIESWAGNILKFRFL